MRHPRDNSAPNRLPLAIDIATVGDLGYDDNLIVVIDHDDDSPIAYTQSRNPRLPTEWD
jgi:hypothetical protein